MEPSGGWISYPTGLVGNGHLPAGMRAEAERRERQGRLLCEVHVMVYEHDAEPVVAFPPGTLLDVDSDPAKIAAAVSRARDELKDWS
jgi:hypothetical protein